MIEGLTKQEIEKFVQSVPSFKTFLGHFPITMEQANLFNFIYNEHVGQTRIEGEPYINHLIRVGEMAEYIPTTYKGREIGWAHDLFEDQLSDITTVEEKAVYFHEKLVEFGYDPFDASHIANGVSELTDRYTKENSNFNRAKRKEFERERLSMVHVNNQTIKYCDIYDNVRNIHRNCRDSRFATLYLKEKSELLLVMNKGASIPLIRCWEQIYREMRFLDII